MNKRALLTPPRYFSHENLSFGNIIKINFDAVNEAIGYLVEVSEDEGINYKLIGYTKENYFIDYSETRFSDYTTEISKMYRFAAVNMYDEVPSNYSRGYKVIIPKKPSELEFAVEGNKNLHSKVFNITNNKETKLLVQNLENNLDIYKTSTLEINPDLNVTNDVLLSDTSSPVEIKDNSDDFGFYIRFSSGTIQYVNKVTLQPYITLNTYGKVITKFEVNQENDLLAILEDTKDGEVLSIYKKDNIIIKKIDFLINELKYKKILDLKLKGNILYVLDENSQFFIYEINKDYGNLTFKHSIFQDDGKFLKPFNIYKKKSYQIKNNLIDFLTINNILNKKEKINFEFNVLNNSLQNKIYDEITELIRVYSTSTNRIFENFEADLLLKLNSIFTLITESETNKIELSKLNLFFIEYLESDLFKIYIKRIFECLEKYYQYENKYLNDSKILISETNQLIIVSSCYYIYILDLLNYRINEYFNCLIPEKEIENIYIKEEDIKTDSLIYKQMEMQNVDRFIQGIKYFEDKNNLGIYFEDISAEFYLNEEMKIQLDPSFSYQYIDFYKMDFNGNYTDIVIDNNYNENFTTLKGFGYDYIQKFEININLFKETIYYLNGKFYNCLKDKYFFQRQKEIQTQLNEDLLDETLIEISKETISHFSLNTRLYITSKEKEINNRNFSLHDIEPRQLLEMQPQDEFYFLNNKKIFKSNGYKNIYCDFEFDSTGENVLVISKKENYYNEKIACCSLFLMNDFLLESNNIIFNDRINIRRFELAGKFLEYKYLATSDPFNFVCYKKDFENKNYIYLFDSQELTFANEQNSFKIQTGANKTNFFLVNALFKRKVLIDDEIEQLPFYLTNDFQIEDYQTITYGNEPIITWRWKRNNDILKYDSYLAVRVSINKEKWNYYNKDISSYTSKVKLNDGINTFYFQFQDSDGVWSKTYKHVYHLKTLKPSIPILENVEYDNQDRGKPLFKWYYDSEILKYKIIYNKELEYYPITKNYHSPEVSFNMVNSDNENIEVEVYAYDKYSNVSDVAKWKFTPNNNNQNPFIMYYTEETNSKKPLIRWKNNSVLTIMEYHIRFNNDQYIKTDKLFAYPEKDLNDGLNSFSIYGIDSLGQKTDSYTYYFEINTINPNIPELTEESLKITKDCNKKDLIINFELDKATNSLYYSFDGFLNTYQFFDYQLDLRNSLDIKEGNNTLYIKYIDKYQNESEVLEYVFYLNDSTNLKPYILNTNNNFVNKPIIKWKQNNNVDFYKIKLYEKNELLFELETSNNSYTTNYNLKNSNYIFKIKSIDYYGIESEESQFEFIINDEIPNDLEFENIIITETSFYLKIKSIKNNENSYFRIKKLDQFQNGLFQKFNDFINLKNLEKGKYLLETKCINSNLFESNITKIEFEIKDIEINKELELEEYSVKYYYDKINNEINIISYKDYNNFQKSIINNGFIYSSDEYVVYEGD